MDRNWLTRNTALWVISTLSTRSMPSSTCWSPGSRTEIHCQKATQLIRWSRIEPHVFFKFPRFGPGFRTSSTTSHRRWMSRQDLLVLNDASHLHGEAAWSGKLCQICQAREEFFRVKKVVEKKKLKLVRDPQDIPRISQDIPGCPYHPPEMTGSLMAKSLKSQGQGEGAGGEKPSCRLPWFGKWWNRLEHEIYWNILKYIEINWNILKYGDYRGMWWVWCMCRNCPNRWNIRMVGKWMQKDVQYGI